MKSLLRHSAIAAVTFCASLFVHAEETATNPAKREPTADEKIVFAALDEKRPELAGIFTAVKAGDYDTASRLWAEHLRTRKGFAWGGPNAPAPQKYNKQVAEDAAIGKVQGGYVPLVYAFPEGKIDWTYNATEHTPGQTPNSEWRLQLNRMLFWVDMARAYQITKDERYPAAFASQLRSWIDQCPLPATVQNDHKSSWRTIETGIRLGHTWIRAFDGFLPSAKLSDADIMAFTRSVIEQARYLHGSPTDVNWLLMEMNGLATTALYFPEFRDSAEWRTFAFDKLAKEMDRQILPDGGHFELSTGYHNDVVITNFQAPAEMAAWTGQEDAIPSTYNRSLERAFDWSLATMTPDRNRPKTNDAWPGDTRFVMRQATKLFPGREDFQWIATDGERGKPPAIGSTFLDWSGFAVMRSGWQPDANYLLFDVGPLGIGGHMGLGHAHQDKLNVVLWAYGREILFDNGGSSYRWDKWRVWSRSSLSHNCVMVDGLGQNRGRNVASAGQEKDPERVSQAPINADWKSDAAFDFASAVYDGPFGTSEYTSAGNYVPGVYDEKAGPQKRRLASHRRSVLFLKPDVFVVVDTMTPIDDKSHRYEARWQLMSTAITKDPVTGTVLTTDPDMPNLAVAPLLADGLEVKYASAQETPELLGWNCRKDETPERLPATTLQHVRSGTGVQRFVTLLLPLKKGENNPIATIKQDGETFEATLTDGRKLGVTFSPAGGVAIVETLADGSRGRSAESALP